MTEEEKLKKLIELYREDGNQAGEFESLQALKELQGKKTLGEELTVKDPGRVAALTGRYGLEAMGGLVDLATSPAKLLLNLGGMDYKSNTYSQAVTESLNEGAFPTILPPGEEGESRIGTTPLPGPETDNEQMVAQATRFVASGGPFVKSGQMMQGAPGLLTNIGKQLSSQPATQAVSAASAGTAGEYSRQQGAGPWGQFLSSLAGGLLPGSIKSAGKHAKTLLPQTSAVERVLARVDTKGLSPGSVTRLKGAVDKALKFGELDDAALKRLVDFERVHATPTQASVTLDPVEKTQQMNLAKSGAQSSNPHLQQLSQVQNKNNAALIQSLDDVAGGVDYDSYSGGQAAIAPVAAKQGRLASQVDDLYAQARDTGGRSLPLQRHQFINRVDELLMADRSTASLPAAVKKELNMIAYGQTKVRGETHAVPFTVDDIDALKSLLARSYGDNGAANHALSLVRKALDETQLQGGASDAAMIAFDKARAASLALYNWGKSTPGIKAITQNKAKPDQFVDKFIIGKGAAVDDVAKLVDEVKADPQAFEALKYQVAAWLKDKAVPRIVEGEGVLASASLNRALKQIGDRKLKLFFGPQELEQIKATNRVAFYEAYQPAGSAINNSNSATTIAGGLLNYMGNNSPTFRALGGLLRGADSVVNDPGRAKMFMRPDLMTPQQSRPILGPLAAPLSMGLLPQPDR